MYIYVFIYVCVYIKKSEHVWGKKHFRDKDFGLRDIFINL